MRLTVMFAAALLASATAVVPAMAQTAAPTAPTKAPLHPITVAQAQELLHLTHADAMQQQMNRNMVNYLRQALPPFVPADVLADIQAKLQNSNFDSKVISIYQQHISERDAAAAIAFYKTPAGQNMVTVMPVIERESMEAGIRAGQEIAHSVILAHKVEIQAAAKKYEQEHPQPTGSQPMMPAPQR